MARGYGPQRLRWVVGVGVVLAVVVLAYTGHQARQARTDLETVAAALEQVAEHLKAGDTVAAREVLDDAQAAAAQAADHVEGPGWWLTSRLPGVRDDVRAVRTVTDVTDHLAQQVLPRIVEVGDSLEPRRLRPEDGTVAVDSLEEVAAAVFAADAELRAQAARVEELDPEQLTDVLAEPVALMQERLRDASALTTNTAAAVRLLPAMLGTEGRRSYLVLFDNNAEIRATGGIPGTYAVVTAEDGKIALEEVGSTSNLGQPSSLPLAPTDAEKRLWGTKLGLFWQNIGFTPDFPRSAQLASAMWEQRTGEIVDGVVSVDPVALSYLLDVTGPVTLPGGRELTADDAVRQLLSDVYQEIRKPAAQDRFFAAAAEAGFEQLTSSAGEPGEVLAALARGVAEGRLHVWSAHPDEQHLLATTALGGQISREPGNRPDVGVFLNDGTGAKMQYYLDHRVDVTPVSCNAAGRQRMRVRLRLRSDAPPGGAGLPSYVVGMARELGLPRGSMRLTTHVYAPIGGWVESVSVDGQEQARDVVEHLGHPVGTRTVELAPGETRTVVWTVRSGRQQVGDPRLRVTPGVHTAGIGRVGLSACNAS